MSATAPTSAPASTADAAAPVPTGPSGPAARALRRPRAERLNAWAAPATTVGVAAVLVAASFLQGAGSSLGPKTATEILLLVVGGALTAWAALRVPDAASRPGMLAIAMFAAFAVLSAVSITWALSPADAWLTTNQLLAYLAAFAGAVALAWLAPDRWPSVIGGVVLAAAAVCGYGVLTKALPGMFNEFELFARLRAPFGYWNAVGLAGALTIPACLWLGARREGAPALNALAYSVLAVALAATLMAYSRGALFAGLVGTVVWFVLSPLRLRGAAVLVVGGAGGLMIGLWTFGEQALTTDRAPLDERIAAGTELLVLLVAVLVLVFAAALVIGFLADVRSFGRETRRRVGIALLVCVALVPAAGAGALATTDDGLRGSVADAWRSLTDTSAVGPANDPGRLTATGSVRSRYWQQAYDAWQDEKVLGVGAGGYATARLRYREDLLDVRHAHGFLPETLAELGAVGVALALALLVAWLVLARSAVRSVAHDARERAGVVTLTAIAVVFGTHSAIDLTWTIPGVALVGLVCAGWVAGRAGAPAAAPARRRLATGRPALAATVGIAVLVFVGAWSAWQPLRSANAADAGFAALDAKRFDEARAHMRTAHERNPLDVEPLLDLAAVELRAGRPKAAEAVLEQATEVQPANWLTWFRLADHRVFDLKDPEGAMRAIRIALYLNPQSWDVTQRYIDIRRRLRSS